MSGGIVLGKSWTLAATGGTTSRECERTQCVDRHTQDGPHRPRETRSRRDTLAYAKDTLAHPTDTLAQRHARASTRSYLLGHSPGRGPAGALANLLRGSKKKNQTKKNSGRKKSVTTEGRLLVATPRAGHAPQRETWTRGETGRRREQKKKQTRREEHSVITVFPHILMSVGSSWHHVDF